MTHHIPVMVVRYEDVRKNKVEQVERMLRFLNYTHSEITDKIQEDFTMFRREHGRDQFEHYTTKQRRLVNDIIMKTARELRVYDVNNSFRLEEYVHKQNV